MKNSHNESIRVHTAMALLRMIADKRRFVVKIAFVAGRVLH